MKVNKIAFIGNFGVSYSSETHYLRTFRKLGYEVICIQENMPVEDALFTEALTADIVFWVHTHGWGTPSLEKFVNHAHVIGKPIVGYHLDLWIGIQREKDLETDLYWRMTDYFFSVDPEMVDLLNSKTYWPKAYFMPAGVFEDECYLAEPNRGKYPHDIIFVGSKDYHPEWSYRPKLINWLQETYGDRFKLYGREQGKHYDQVRGHELNVLYSSAKVVIGDTLCPGFNKPSYLSDRIFETTGRGGMIIHPYIKGIEDFFQIGKEIVTYKYGDFYELKEKIDYYLEHEDERESIRLAGHERTKQDHTYTHRLSKIISILENEC